MLAKDYKVLNLLKKYLENCEDFPVHSFGKLIICGHSEAGKSTLAQVIIGSSQERSSEEHHKLMKERIKSVELHTAGIVPHYIKIPNGNIVLYDLAGHHEYYSSHSSCLETISLHSPSTFLLLSDLSKGINSSKRISDVKDEYHYWSALIGNISKTHQSSVIVLGTHADKISSEDINFIREHLKESAKDIVQGYNLSFTQFFALDARAYESEDMKAFMSTLYNTVESVKKRGPPISLSCHVLYAFLKDRVPSNVDAITLSKLLARLAQEPEQNLSSSSDDIASYLSTLSDKGLIIFFPNSNPSCSWIVIKPEVIFSKIIGKLFKPDKFRHLIASNVGIIPVSVLRKEFPEHNIDMILQVLVHFELCQKVPGRLFTSQRSPDLPEPESSAYMFFPALVNEKKPEDISPSTNGFVWKMRVDTTAQFYVTRFLHVLLLRLADTFPSHVVISQLDQILRNFSRLCKVWSRGISWNNESGITTTFEMEESFKCLSVTIDGNKQDPEYPIALKEVIKVIKSTCEELCPSVVKHVKDTIECPPGAGGPAEVELSVLRKAMKPNGKTIDITGEKIIDLDKWQEIEPQLQSIIGLNEPIDNPILQDRPELCDLMNDIASVIPAKWRAVGIELKLQRGILDGIQSECGNKPNPCFCSFEKVFAEWEKQESRPYTWQTIITALKAPAVGEVALAEKLNAAKIFGGSKHPNRRAADDNSHCIVE